MDGTLNNMEYLFFHDQWIALTLIEGKNTHALSFELLFGFSAPGSNWMCPAATLPPSLKIIWIK